MTDQPTQADVIRAAIADAVQICNGPLIDHAAAGVLYALGKTELPPADGAPGPADDLRERYVTAIEDNVTIWRPDAQAAADAVLTVRDTELQRLRAELTRLQEAGDHHLGAAEAEVEKLGRRVDLAHQARRAKEHQLDGIRRALCDVGAMQDGDPYSHADLEDVIRQTVKAAL